MTLEKMLREDRNRWKCLCRRAIEILRRHAPPDGLKDREALSELYTVFDGPEQRKAEQLEVHRSLTRFDSAPR